MQEQTKGKEVTSEYEALVRNTIEQLDGIMNVSVKQALKDYVKKALGKSVRTKDPFFWPAGMLMLGLVSAWEYLDKCEDTQKLKDDIGACLEAHVDLWLKKTGGKIDYVDDALAGFSLVELYNRTGKDKYKNAAMAIEAHIKGAKRDPEGAVVYNSGRGGNIFADGIGQVAMYMAVCDDETLRFEGSKQLDLYYKYGMDEASGLPYHGYELKKSASGNEYISEKKGILSWGRAFGWLIMGACANAALDTPGEKTLNEFKSLCTAALKYQRKDGGWSWQIQAVDGHIDMSATGMIAFALGYAVKYKVFGEDGIVKEIEEALNKAAECMFIHSANGTVNDALSSCDDFGVHYQTYGSYPWGQGAVLAALSVINMLPEM